jgi:hypothetical protein
MVSVGNPFLFAKVLDMNEYDAPVSNRIQCCKRVKWKRTHHFLHIDVVHMSLLE